MSFWTIFFTIIWTLWFGNYVVRIFRFGDAVSHAYRIYRVGHPFSSDTKIRSVMFLVYAVEATILLVVITKIWGAW